MTERWISTKKHYCKYCNTWIPDTKVSRQQHDISDRHKNAMQRNLSRLQRDQLIARQRDSSIAAPKPTAASSASVMRRTGAPNTAAYGYGERDDMVKFLADGKKMNFKELPVPEAPIPQSMRETHIGKWEVMQIITKEENGEEGGVKEESPEVDGIRAGRAVKDVSEVAKWEKARAPDEDLRRFRVEEKVFPVEVKEEDEVKVPSVGFKKRKIGVKNSRVTGAL
jgi:U1 zinc finger